MKWEIIIDITIVGSIVLGLFFSWAVKYWGYLEMAWIYKKKAIQRKLFIALMVCVAFIGIALILFALHLLGYSSLPFNPVNL